MYWVYVLSIGAALFFGFGSVVQQRSAAEAPPEDMLSFRLLLWLVRQRLWLVGVVLSLVGNLLSASALGRGSVALVEPLFVVRLLFALPLAAAWGKHSVPRRDWAGALLTAAGLAAFVVAGQPSEGRDSASWLGWSISAGLVLALSLTLAAWSRRWSPPRMAAGLAVGAGTLFAYQASLTHTAIRLWQDDGLWSMLASWHPYAVAAAALLGTLLLQSAYEAAPLPASFPALVTVEPFVGIALGVGLMGGALRVGWVVVPFEAFGIGLMVYGIWILARSPLVTGEIDRLERRQEEGLAIRTEEELERDLAKLHRDLDEFARGLGDPEIAEKSRRQVDEDLRRIDDEIERLCTLQEDIARHREAEAEREREHADELSSGDREEIQRHREDLEERERRIDARADELRSRADRLQQRVRELAGPGSRLVNDSEERRSAR